MSAQVKNDPLTKAYENLSATVKDINKQITFYNIKTVMKTCLIFFAHVATHVALILYFVNTFGIPGGLCTIPISIYLDKALHQNAFKNQSNQEEFFVKNMQQKITDLFSSFKPNIKKSFEPLSMNSIFTRPILLLGNTDFVTVYNNKFSFSYRHFDLLDKLEMEPFDAVKQKYDNTGFFSWFKKA